LKEWSHGHHYDRVEALTEAANCEGPFVCFDADEQGNGPKIGQAERGKGWKNRRSK
jgi:hypothetical protein